jgi:hypothetical protein
MNYNNLWGILTETKLVICNIPRDAEYPSNKSKCDITCPYTSKYAMK